MNVESDEQLENLRQVRSTRKACSPVGFSADAVSSSAPGTFSCVASSFDLTGSSGLSISIAVGAGSGTVEGAAGAGSSAIVGASRDGETGQGTSVNAGKVTGNVM